MEADSKRFGFDQPAPTATFAREVVDFVMGVGAAIAFCAVPTLLVCLGLWMFSAWAYASALPQIFSAP